MFLVNINVADFHRYKYKVVTFSIFYGRVGSESETFQPPSPMDTPLTTRVGKFVFIFALALTLATRDEFAKICDRIFIAVRSPQAATILKPTTFDISFKTERNSYESNGAGQFRKYTTKKRVPSEKV